MIKERDEEALERVFDELVGAVEGLQEGEGEDESVKVKVGVTLLELGEIRYGVTTFAIWWDIRS